MSTVGNREKLASFQGLTQIHDAELATSLLTASNWDVSLAVTRWYDGQVLQSTPPQRANTGTTNRTVPQPRARRIVPSSPPRRDPPPSTSTASYSQWLG